MAPGFFTALLVDGAFQQDAGLPLSDRGFRYGMSVFETIALRLGAPLLLEPHLSRLAETSAAAGMRPPRDWLDAARDAIQRPPIEEGVARIYVTAGDSDRDDSRIALLFEAIPIPAELTRARAVTAEFTPALPFGKTGNYWPHFLVRPSSGEEAILCTPQNLLLGGSMANLFLLIDGSLLTPRQPLRQGIVRDWIRAEETGLTRGDLARAHAAFLSNSRFGLCELTAIDGRELPGDPRIGDLWQRYRTEVLRVR